MSKQRPTDGRTDGIDYNIINKTTSFFNADIFETLRVFFNVRLSEKRTLKVHCNVFRLKTKLITNK